MKRLTPHAIGAVVASVAWLGLSPVSALAHAGHKALPTKGAQVDVEHGLITLSPEAFKALEVQAAEVDVGPVAEKVLAYATLIAPWQKHAFVTSRIGGRIAKLYVQPGETVRLGQTIAEVESPELENLELDLLNAENALRLSEKSAEQLSLLARDNLVAGKEVIEALARNRENRDAVAIARSKLLSLGLSEASLKELEVAGDRATVRYLPIVSSAAGQVIHADLTIGKVVEPNEHLFEIVDVATVWVQIGVLEQDLYRVQAGQQIQLTLNAYPNETVTAQVDVRTPYLDPQTHLGTVWGHLINDPAKSPRFLPGMYGQAQIIVSKSDKSVRVPPAALVADGAERYVLVEEAATEKSHEYRRQNVVVGIQNTASVQILSGKVFPGDRVVTASSHELGSFFVQGTLRLSPEAKRNIGLRIEPVGNHPIDEVIELDGRVEIPADHRGVISSPVAGTLESIRVDRSQQVHKGDIVGEVSSLEMQNLQLELLRSHLQLGVHEDAMKRLGSLVQDQLVGRSKLWEAQAEATAARNRKESAMRRLEQLGFSQEQIAGILTGQKLLPTLPLRSPIEGTLVHFDKTLGQAIKAEEPLFEVHDLTHPRIEAYVIESELSQVSLGQAARVRFVADRDFVADGKLSRSGGTFGSDHRTLEIWVDLTTKPLLPLEHNMLARVTLSRGHSESTLTVPPTSLVSEGTRQYVFVEKADGSFDRRSVATGRADDRFVEIRQGLSVGDSVVVRGAAGLQTAYASLR